MKGNTFMYLECSYISLEKVNLNNDSRKKGKTYIQTLEARKVK